MMAAHSGDVLCCVGFIFVVVFNFCVSASKNGTYLKSRESRVSLSNNQYEFFLNFVVKY